MPSSGGDPSPTGTRPPQTKFAKRKVHLKTEIIGWPDALRFHGSVIPSIVVPVTVMTLWSVFIWVLAEFALGDISKLAMPPIFITIISLVLSLLLVFRTNTAYERYWEGRKLWGTMMVLCRNLARIIWVSVEEQDDKDHKEKLAAMDLIVAFFIATKNHLRAEYGLKDSKGEWRRELTNRIPKKRRNDLQAREEARHRDGSAPGGGGMPILGLQRTNTRNSAVPSVDVAIHMHGALAAERTNLPVDITHLLSAYITSQRKRERIDIPQFGAMVQALSSCIDTLTSLERILTSPIPAAYRLHLKQALYIYLLMLPFQLLSAFRGLSILIVFLASFTLLGVESIGGEIEQPFGYDANDLDLDSFCEDMVLEIDALVSKPPISLADWELTKPYGSELVATPGASSFAASSAMGPRAAQSGSFSGPLGAGMNGSFAGDTPLIRAQDK